jgi:hypothetical protein
MVIVAVPFLVVSETEVAVTVTLAGLGTFAGALKVTDVMVTFERLPQVGPLQPAPDSAQVTPWDWKSLLTVAVKACVPYPVGTLALVGETLTTIGNPAPLAERKAARPTPQGSEEDKVAFAETAPAALCS